MTMTDEKRKAYIMALLEERRGYVMRDQPEKVAAVDAELRRVGFDAAPPVRRAERRGVRS